MQMRHGTAGFLLFLVKGLLRLTVLFLVVLLPGRFPI